LKFGTQKRDIQISASFLRKNRGFKPRFRGCPLFVEMGHSKRKIEKSKCKNEKESNLNPEFSYS